MADLGSAAVGPAGAPTRLRRKTASLGPRRRSRSPLGDGDEQRVPTAEKAAKAPVYVEPGSSDDTAGIRSNAQRVFEYLSHIEHVLNDHAEALDAADAVGDDTRRRAKKSDLEMAHMKEVVMRTDIATKQSIEENDVRLKHDTATAIQGVWEFLEKNNAGIS